MKHPETHVITKEHGPRPAGDPELCFYCDQPVGGTHTERCVLRQKTVLLQYTFDVVVTVPEHWTQEQIEFHRNESTWCAGNAVEYDLTYRKDAVCFCPDFTAKYLREATPEDEEKWDLKVMK